MVSRVRGERREELDKGCLAVQHGAFFALSQIVFSLGS
jgi:hypothetical protein